jgi:hypothetical protein
MTSKIKYITAVAFIALMTTSTSFAGEIEIGGNALNVGVVSGAATNLAVGFNSKADQAIGVISGDSDTKVGGNLLNVGVVTGAATNLAVGFNSKACQEVGAIGKDC